MSEYRGIRYICVGGAHGGYARDGEWIAPTLADRQALANERLRALEAAFGRLAAALKPAIEAFAAIGRAIGRTIDEANARAKANDARSQHRKPWKGVGPVFMLGPDGVSRIDDVTTWKLER